MIIKSDYIRDRLSFIESKVKNDTKQKLYDINKTAEDIFMHLLNDVYGWQLVNANDIKSNFPAIDLIDTNKEIVIQVTSSMDDVKVVSTIEKFAKFSDDTYKDGAYKQYSDYDLKMFYIKEKPDKFSKATQTKIDNQGMSDDDFLGIENINTNVSANPNIAQKVFKTLCKLLHDKVCESDISPQLTTKLGKSTLIGREKELQEIDEQLKASKTLLVKGIGGVGKSTIASNYLHRHKDEYDYYGFFEGIESFESELELAFKLEIEQGQDRLDRVLRELIKLDGNKLLVIDDVKEIEYNQEKLEKILGLEHNGYRVLLTSREEIEDVEQYDLDVLSIDDAKKLFNSIYEVEDDVLLEEILEYLDCHAFFIDKTAHSIKKTLTPEMIRDKFKNGEFSKISVKRKESFNKFLNELFTLDGLDYEEVLMLKQLSVLPSIEINFENLEYIFQKKNDSEFEELLDFLSQKGWISKLEENYKLHQIIKEYILTNYTPSFEEIEMVVDSFNTLLYNSADAQVAVNNRYNIIYFDSLVTLLKKLAIENEKIKNFFTHIGNIYKYLGFYKKAEPFYLKSLEICKNILGEKHLNTSVSYNNLAEFYRTMGEYKKAEPLYLKSLEISENHRGESYPYIASQYNNLALLYYSMGEYKKAEPLYLKALKVINNIEGEENSSIALFYNNIALLYESIREYKKAEPFYLKSLEIGEKIFENNHPRRALSYNNLAGLYESMKEYKKAKIFYQKALNIREKVLGEKHPDTATSYNDLALLYCSMNGYTKDAELLYKKALQIREDIFGEIHPSVAQSYNNLALYTYVQKDYTKAYNYMKKAIEIYSKFLSDTHPDLINSKEGLVEIKQKLEKKIPLKFFEKPKRNNPCPCNSGKKYKKCCGKNS